MVRVGQIVSQLDTEEKKYFTPEVVSICCIFGVFTLFMRLWLVSIALFSMGLFLYMIDDQMTRSARRYQAFIDRMTKYNEEDGIIQKVITRDNEKYLVIRIGDDIIQTLRPFSQYCSSLGTYIKEKNEYVTDSGMVNLLVGTACKVYRDADDLLVKIIAEDGEVFVL